MALTYIANGTSSTITCGNKYTVGRFGQETYDLTRGFYRFDLSSYGLTLASITSVTFNIYVYNTAGTQNYKLRSAISTDSNWGVAVNANAADFDSTTAHLEDTRSIGSTGWKTFTVDKNNLDLSGTTWFRIAGVNENTTFTTNITTYSQDNATLKPYLEITTVDATGKTYIIQAQMIF